MSWEASYVTQPAKRESKVSSGDSIKANWILHLPSPHCLVLVLVLVLMFAFEAAK